MAYMVVLMLSLFSVVAAPVLLIAYGVCIYLARTRMPAGHDA